MFNAFSELSYWTMSLDLGLGEIFQDFKNTTEKMGTNVDNISKSTNRLLVEIAKPKTVNFPAKKHELLCKSAEKMLEIVENFESNGGLDESPKAESSAEDKVKFEDFKEMIESRDTTISMEAARLGALDDIVKHLEME